MSEISKYKRSRQVIAERIIQLWRQSLVAFSNGNNKRVKEINSFIDQLQQFVKQIDGRLESIDVKS
ncbi:MAG TPA: hypothetical protein VGI43_07185 [Mucilaginibacter sp.]|jgi:ABC-type transporter Mla subunit MlaD